MCVSEVAMVVRIERDRKRERIEESNTGKI